MQALSFPHPLLSLNALTCVHRSRHYRVDICIFVSVCARTPTCLGCGVPARLRWHAVMRQQDSCFINAYACVAASDRMVIRSGHSRPARCHTDVGLPRKPAGRQIPTWALLHGRGRHARQEGVLEGTVDLSLNQAPRFQALQARPRWLNLHNLSHLWPGPLNPDTEPAQLCAGIGRKGGEGTLSQSAPTAPKAPTGSLSAA